MYPTTSEFRTYVSVDGIDEVSEGASRPGFFRGVATVVAKLFNIVNPTVAYFGQKDGLQCYVIKKMVEDLNIPVVISVLPTARLPDGLAMNSRNVYLNEEERAIAPSLYKALLKIQDKVESGERCVQTLKNEAKGYLKQFGNKLEIQYISVADCETVDELFGIVSETSLTKGLFVSGAIRLGSTRIIDNIIIKTPRPLFGWPLKCRRLLPDLPGISSIGYIYHRFIERI
jgi:pantoate--beta-alanine ligase